MLRASFTGISKNTCSIIFFFKNPETSLIYLHTRVWVLVFHKGNVLHASAAKDNKAHMKLNRISSTVEKCSVGFVYIRMRGTMNDEVPKEVLNNFSTLIKIEMILI